MSEQDETALSVLTQENCQRSHENTQRPAKKAQGVGWAGDSSAVRRPAILLEFSFQHPHGGSELHVTLFQET